MHKSSKSCHDEGYDWEEAFWNLLDLSDYEDDGWSLDDELYDFEEEMNAQDAMMEKMAPPVLGTRRRIRTNRVGKQKFWHDRDHESNWRHDRKRFRRTSVLSLETEPSVLEEENLLTAELDEDGWPTFYPIPYTSLTPYEVKGKRIRRASVTKRFAPMTSRGRRKLAEDELWEQRDRLYAVVYPERPGRLYTNRQWRKEHPVPIVWNLWQDGKLSAEKMTIEELGACFPHAARYFGDWAGGGVKMLNFILYIRDQAKKKKGGNHKLYMAVSRWLKENDTAYQLYIKMKHRERFGHFGWNPEYFIVYPKNHPLGVKVY